MWVLTSNPEVPLSPRDCAGEVDFHLSIGSISLKFQPKPVVATSSAQWSRTEGLVEFGAFSSVLKIVLFNLDVLTLG